LADKRNHVSSSFSQLTHDYGAFIFEKKLYLKIALLFSIYPEKGNSF